MKKSFRQKRLNTGVITTFTVTCYSNITCTVHNTVHSIIECCCCTVVCVSLSAKSCSISNRNLYRKLSDFKNPFLCSVSMKRRREFDTIMSVQPILSKASHREGSSGSEKDRPDLKDGDESKSDRGLIRHLNSHYKITSELGAGRFSVVLCADDTVTGETVALKLVEQHSENVRCIESETAAFRNLLPHKHIATLLRVETDVLYDRRCHTVFVMRPGVHGNMLSKILGCGHFCEALSRTYYSQLLQALKFSHSCKIYHLDIKPDNLVFDENFNVLLCDWGLSMYVSCEHSPEQRCVGTPQYMAPEMHGNGMYDPAKADIWSATCVLFSMITGRPPFSKATGADWHFKKLINRQRDKFWSSHRSHAPWISEGFIKLVDRVLADIEFDRPSIDDIFTDPWMLEPLLPQAKIIMEMKLLTTKSTT